MLKFLVFSDFHYKKGMYAIGIEHLETILNRAKNEKVDFVIHLGDLCNDYNGSPELLKAYLQNRYSLPVYGVYGNHELEGKNNCMDFVTPCLCNRKVVFADPDVGYWYTDIKVFRLIGLDTNYSYNDSLQLWEHNHEGSHGAPKGNRFVNSLSPKQLEWFDSILNDAALQNKKALVFSHAAFSGLWESSDDADAVQNLYRKYKNNVMLSLNGHLHTDHLAQLDSVFYFDVNAVLNGHWDICTEHHYQDDHTYSFVNYNSIGEAVELQNIPLKKLGQGKNSWFFTQPLSAVITISDDFTITIDGSETSWVYEIAPDRFPDGCRPRISSHCVKWNPA